MLGLWLVGFVLLLYVVWRFQRAGRSLSQSVLLGLVLGMSYAWVLSFFQGCVKGLLPWVHLVGYGYAGLLKMIAMPLAVVSVLSAIVRVGKASTDRAIAFWVIAILMAMTAIAALDGVMVANLFDLDASAIVRVEQRLALEQYWINWRLEEGDWTLRSLVFMVFPKLIASALSGLTDMVMISLMIVAMFFALAALAVVKKDPETGAQIVQVIEGLQVWVMALVRIIIRLTPYGFWR
nr:cation:dicarboxylase symporter family transporter [Rappaport israeli]